MRRRLALIGIAVLLVGGLSPGAVRANPDRSCTDRSEACVIETAMTYLDALVSHDVDSVRLAPDVWRMGNGRVDARGEDELRRVIEREPVAGFSGVRWVVDGEDAVAFYDLEADFTRTAQSATFGPEATHVPAYVAERFKVRNGLIHEIEVIYWGDPTMSERPDRPYRPADVGRGPCPAPTRQCAVSTAQLYLDALLSHDGSQVPLAVDAWRLENGMNTGEGDEEIRAGLSSSAMDVIRSMEDIRWYHDGDQVVALYLLWSDGTGFVTSPPSGPEQLLTPTYIAERFRVQDGLIKEIEAIFWIGPPGTTPDERPS